jgi:uncharacterized protein
MSLDILILFLLLALIAEILGTIGGFGSSLFFIPIANLFFDFHTVLGITALFHVLSNLSKIYFFRKGYDKKLLISIGIPSIVFVSIGAILSNYLKSEYLEFGMGIFLVILSIVMFIYRKIKLNPSTSNAIIGGSLAGLLAGVFGTGGAIRGLVLSAFSLSKTAFISTSAFIDLGVDLSRSVVYFFNGFISSTILYLIPLLFIISILGTFLGKMLLKKISEENFKNFVLFLVFVTGLINVLSFLINVKI